MTDENDKTISARCLTRASEYDMTVPQYFEILPENAEYADLFRPSFWRHHPNLRPNSLIRVRHALGTFDVIVNVVHKVAGGVLVEFFSGRPPRGVDPYRVENDVRAEAMRLQMAPIATDGKPVCRVQYLPKTDFRVLGLGSAEIERSIKTHAAAEAVLANYLTGLNMRNPTPEELLAHANKKAAALEAAQTPKEPAPAQ